ncbi:MAG: site-specific DNA-methyltransferase [Okeania sp. SIO3B5]|uniref:DNA-methyltransferase n=1 Tax=Okeania sp. SIO3B5 TaxID=2607811 RepID=UPI0014005066|nr:site-specific DNA-methyltransferase [Okeania sp. SIO3B5]NEO53731.1 site-specific DNA-methyltransferase [Okeania sp. SIO3B5]
MAKQLSLNFNNLSKFSWEKCFEDAQKIEPCFSSTQGILFEANCLKILPNIKDEIADVIFADPPFNLGKNYGNKSNDSLADSEYLNWCFAWINECCRILKPGGSLFIYNLPKWNILLGSHLINCGLSFRHWITINLKVSMPITGRLYPSHYSLLYYSKGKPKVFRKIRTPIETCRHCGKEIKDYGGHRQAMNPLGVNLTDVWNDIPPVRHWKFKSKKRKTNQLSTKLLDRVIQMSSLPGDLIIDPFGGSGTTYAVCEANSRNWIGVEIQNCDVIIERLTEGNLHYHQNNDYVES